jgi:epoxyqueuosine reductase
VRNVLYALGNAGDPALMTAITPRLDDPSALVRGAAVWALGRLAAAADIEAQAAARAPAEPDPDVRAEWAALYNPDLRR